MPPEDINTSHSLGGRDTASLLSPVAYDDDASSLHSRSDQDTDSDDDELISRARNSRELRAHDRIVLMEEEELDELVTNTRKQQERTRRGSALAVPNPLKIFGRRGSSPKSTTSVGSSTETFSSEKRDARRTRRQQKKHRLMEHADHGEDGELMYEMEEGGMKEGSSTGDSSEREDSGEVDRRHMDMITNAKAQRRRSWRRWVFIHTLIAIGFAILVLIAWKLSKNRKSAAKKSDLLSNGTALFAPTTIIISLDGFRADFLQRGITPNLNEFVNKGVSPKWMHPSFPSVTFPNHYTLATGLYPESHGVVGNSFWDPKLQAEFYYTDPDRSLEPKWWGGEPFWVTAERQGARSAIHMWPGSEAHILNIEPTILDKYNGEEKLDNKVARIMEWLDRPGKEDETVEAKKTRPQLIAAYVPNVDADGHRYGPNSTEIRITIEEVDTMMGNIFAGLERRNLTEIVNVIVVSDHGMATTDVSRLIQLEDLVDTDKIEHTDGWPLYGLRPKKSDDLMDLYHGLEEKSKSNPNFEVYLRDVNMPERYHFSKNHRIAPLWIVPRTGWAIVTKEEFSVKDGLKNNIPYSPRGLHGYDHEHPLMRAIFVARGPAFPHPANSQIEVFQNTEVYNLLCDSLWIEPRPNNGTLRLPLKPMGTHKPEDTPEEPEDPETTPSPQPARPELPEKPTQPGRPTIPSKPPTPERPPLPQKPTEPAKPERPTIPEKPTAPAHPNIPKKPTESKPAAPSESASNGDKSMKEDVEEKVHDIWDWITDKVGNLWDKVKGNTSDKHD